MAVNRGTGTIDDRLGGKKSEGKKVECLGKRKADCLEKTHSFQRSIEQFFSH